MKATIIPVEGIDLLWDRVKDILAPAVSVCNGRWTTYDVYNALQRGQLNLFVAFDENREIHGCVATQIIDYPSKRYLCLLFVAGDNIRQWLEPMNELLTHWANDNSCDGLEGMGRIEWMRLLRSIGCETVAYAFERSI